MATPPYTPPECEFYLNEFFILRPFRGKGIAEFAAKEVFNLHLGNWELQTNPTGTNRRAQHFWRKTLQDYTGDSYQEDCRESYDDELKMIFTFSNRLRS